MEEKTDSGRSVKVRLRVSGVEVDIEAPPEGIEEAVKNVLKGVKDAIPIERARATELATGPKPTTCKRVIEELWKEGWFSRPRALGEVWEEIVRRGYNYDRSAVAHALLDLTREGRIARRGKARRYVYVQKIPHSITYQ